jgi:phospholipase C
LILINLISKRFTFFAGLAILSVVSLGCGGSSSSSASTPSPSSPTFTTPLKHVIVVILQNHSFDSLFATFPGLQNPLGSGSPGYVQMNAASVANISPYVLTNPMPADMYHGYTVYSASIDGGKMDGFAVAERDDNSMGHYDNTIPGVDALWNYASKFALADNFFAPSINTEPNLLLDMVSATDLGGHYGSQPSYGPCNKPDSTARPLTNPNLGDQLNTANVSWAWFQEEMNPANCAEYVPVENPFQYFTSTQNSSNLQDLSNFYTQLNNGTLPAVSFVTPGGAHNCHPGNDSITVCLQYLDQMLQQIQASPVWSSTAVLVYWDESGGFYDHVAPPTVGGIPDGIRIPLIVVSPLARPGYVSHVQMDNISILRFIQWNWGLPSLNARNSAPGATIEMRDLFTF